MTREEMLAECDRVEREVGDPNRYALVVIERKHPLRSPRVKVMTGALGRCVGELDKRNGMRRFLVEVRVVTLRKALGA